MTGRLQTIYRHPIKGIGRERLQDVDLAAAQPLPGDRAWALLHDGAAEDTDDWQPRRNFLVVASGPKLAQVEARQETGRIHLAHPDRPDLALDPETDGKTLIDWVAPLWPEERPGPRRLVRAPEKGMADNGMAQVSILNLASLHALSQKVGQDLAMERFRGNLILDGLAPWEEFDWIGRTISIGTIRFNVTDRIERCRATEANPRTGLRDANTLRALEDGWAHRDFGVYATVATDGKLSVGDPVTA
ncbi:MAG: MOSC domain-containing protein [Pseudomonadota bacterium]